jgi:asparagine synthase (glutamine-hydrolysing)
MPGIVGIISKRPAQICKDRLGQMIERMIHERFYASSTYVNGRLGVYAGLVGFEGSFSNSALVLNEEKNLVLLFAGENFADNDLKIWLKQKGHVFDPSNASYLIHLYEESGEQFFQQLNGWFSGVLLDLRKEEVIIFNDRYGMSRIYYHEGQEEFLFSSEAKSLLRVRPELRRIDLESLGEFFSCGCTLENKSLFSKVFLLPGGSAWKVLNGSIAEKRSYFDAGVWESQDVLGKEEFYQRLRDVFSTIVPRYFQGNDNIGISLTGGLDTRAILAYMDNRPGGLPCYTFGGLGRETFDIQVARKVADACRQAHMVLKVDERFFSEFSAHAEKAIYVSDGYSDVCGAHEVYLNSLARQISPIRMTGNYGSEVLRNVSNFGARLSNENILDPDFEKYAQQAIGTFQKISKGHKVSFTAFKEIPWRMYGCNVSAQSQLTVRSPYMDNDLIRLVYQAPEDARSNNEIALRLIADKNMRLSGILTDMGAGVGRNAWVLNCAQIVYKTLFRVEWYYSVGLPHWLIRLDNVLRFLQPERLMLGWHRYLHYRMWFRYELSNYMQQMLLDTRTMSRPYLNARVLENMIVNHINGIGNYTNEINKILTIELIERRLIEE